MHLKRPFLAFFAVALTAMSLVLTPTIDKIQLSNSWQYPLFYASTVPPIYYVATVYLALLAVLSKDRGVKLLSVVLLTFLIVYTPSIMLVNPWLPDQYPYLAEAVWLTKYHHITELHRLGETPGLGLMFSQLMLISGLGAFDISKIYSLLMVLVAPFVFLVGEYTCGDGALASMILLGFAYPPRCVYHRNTFFFLLLVFLVFLLFKNLNKRGAGHVIAYALTFTAISISYPGIIVFIIALSIATLILYLFCERSNRPISFGTPLFSTIIFLSWQVFIAKKMFGYIVGNIYYGLQEFFNPTISGMLGISVYRGASLTEVNNTLISIRIGFTVMLLILATVVTLYTLIFSRERRSLVFASLLFLGSAVQFLILTLFVFYGPWFAKKFDAYFVYISAICVAALPTLKFIGKHERKVRLALLCVVVVALLLVPLLSYLGIPYLHTPSSELRAKIFIDTHYFSKEPIFATEMNLPYTLFEVMLDRRSPVNLRAILSPGEPIRYDSNYLILQRFATRDGYFVRPIGYKDYLETLTRSLTMSHNIVYDGGAYTELFVRV